MSEWLLISRHAAERWHQRTDSPGVGPRVAWAEAERRSVPGVRADEVRYHRGSETVLVRVGGVLVTVIDATTASRELRQAISGGASA